jgi:hypothetical protein
MNVTHKEAMMNENAALIGLIDNAPARRLWLLHSALQNLPLDRAIELARIAEAFVTGSPAQQQLLLGESEGHAGPKVAKDLDQTDRIIREKSPSSVDYAATTDRARLVLSTEQRDRLLQRLAEGAKNPELAAEFGLSMKQVQGLRIGSAREIAKRREPLGKNSAYPQRDAAHSAPIDEIVRYLRQQNDVVVSQEDGFRVNGRFNLSSADLVARANRMRARQNKPPFELAGGASVRAENVSSASGHPLFWNGSASAKALPKPAG